MRHLFIKLSVTAMKLCTQKIPVWKSDPEICFNPQGETSVQDRNEDDINLFMD